MDRRTFLKTAAGAGAVLAAGGFATPAISQRAAARALRLVPHADVANFDPIWSSAYIARNAGLLVWDMLYGMDAKLQVQRQMVEAEEEYSDGAKKPDLSATRRHQSKKAQPELAIDHLREMTTGYLRRRASD